MSGYQVSSPIRVLVIDDEPAIRRALRASLTQLGFTVEEVSRGEDGLLLVQTESFDAVLLDINMPGMGGIKTLHKLRAMAPRLPILMLTVQDSEQSKIEALERGADDYITKPFSMGECMARIRSAVRRSQTPERPGDAPLTIGEIQVLPVRRTVTKAGRPIHLTPKEYEILYFLMLNAGRAVTYGKLLTAVWGTEFRDEVDYVRTFVRQLRKKIEDDPSNPRYLLTDAYVGYRFVESLPSSGAEAE
ncbi:MAG TPA: response regulator transcription factor [Acidobacteriaceae bacterium]|nr:response regulator transcription factor [Acidobacteriaceae bacterium]